MMNMFESKKGFNDVTILISILSIFVVTAMIIPNVQELSGEAASSFSTDGVTENLRDDSREIGIVSPTGIKDFFSTLWGIMTWNKDIMPTWLGAFYVMMEITALVVIVRNIWIGGGG
jgi:hypothetical protein